MKHISYSQRGRKKTLHLRDERGNKKCSGCLKWLPEYRFGKNVALPDGLANNCRDCQWSNGLWSKYRIRGTDYVSLLHAQGGICAICKGSGPLVVDHDHACCAGARSCGRCVRALICSKCNQGIGLLMDDPDILRSAAAYIERYAK